MIVLKLALLVLLVFVPLTPVLLSLPLLSTLVVAALTAIWLLVPSWGGWIFVGTSFGLIQSRVWQLYLQRLKMSVYVSSPSMAIQNRSAVWLAIGAAVGAIRSGIGGDIGWAVVGALLAITLFASQGILFPNAAVISQACGYPLVSLDELQSLLNRLDYPTLLAFNKESRRAGAFGVDLDTYLKKRARS
jgi:hypothetical protein